MDSDLEARTKVGVTSDREARAIILHWTHTCICSVQNNLFYPNLTHSIDVYFWSLWINLKFRFIVSYFLAVRLIGYVLNHLSHYFLYGDFISSQPVPRGYMLGQGVGIMSLCLSVCLYLLILLLFCQSRGGIITDLSRCQSLGISHSMIFRLVLEDEMTPPPLVPWDRDRSLGTDSYTGPRRSLL